MGKFKSCTKCKEVVELGTRCKEDSKLIHTIDSRMGRGYPYFDEILGVDVTSRSEKNQIMRENNLIERG